MHIALLSLAVCLIMLNSTEHSLIGDLLIDESNIAI